MRLPQPPDCKRMRCHDKIVAIPRADTRCRRARRRTHAAPHARRPKLAQPQPYSLSNTLQTIVKQKKHFSCFSSAKQSRNRNTATFTPNNTPIENKDDPSPNRSRRSRFNYRYAARPQSHELRLYCRYGCFTDGCPTSPIDLGAGLLTGIDRNYAREPRAARVALTATKKLRTNNTHR